MKLFAQLVRTTINLALLPIVVAQDIITAPLDATETTGRNVGERTRAHIEKLKDEASE